ncbi:RDD family protein [Streptosporangium sp. NPDC002721]|uniref:RDD family protein n=1 Tax=Streptosporangium sp. NPDC002721 TaxID=3366188 RepID=UPI00367BDF39
MEITTEWAVPTLLVLLGLLACLVRGNPATVGRRVAGLLVLNAAIVPLASLRIEQGICRETIPLFGADWFGAVAGAWGTTQLCPLAAAALLLAASRTVRPATGDEPAASRDGMVWRRPIAALADYLIVVRVLSAVAGTAGYLIGFPPRMGTGLLERAGEHVFQNRVRPEGVAVLAWVFLHVWAQHVLWGRTPGKRLLGIRVIDARTGGRPGAGKVALRTLFFPVLALVPGIGLPCLLVAGAWTLLDPEGRVLHDRLLGATVAGRGHVEPRPVRPT